MRFKALGTSNIQVSAICLGTMTWGEQNTQAQAFEQMDLALDQGINFFDTAELYPVLPSKETYGKSEEIIGNWLSLHQCRDKIVLASKAAGPGRTYSALKYIRGGPKFSAQQLQQALDASLKRLKTDYIDLYQLHWPERNTNIFGVLGFTPSHHEFYHPFDEVLQALQSFVQQGKIRAIGVSNETPWGMMQYLKSADSNLPTIASIQNPYNLLNRTFEIGLAEISHREQVAFLAYSPLAFGTLTGKYLYEKMPAKARLAVFPAYKRYTSEISRRSIENYVRLADEFNLSPAQMALSFVTSRPFVTSSIIGATTIAQLKENINSIHITLPEGLLAKIEAIHLSSPNPTP